MRQIGSLSSEQEARRFSDYLLTQGIEAQPTEENGGDWAIWVHDENKLDSARQQYQEFRSNPSDPRYQKTSNQAESIRRREEQERRKKQRNVVEMRERWRQQGAGRVPLTMTLIGLCVLVAFATSFGKAPGPTSPLLFSTADLRADSDLSREPLDDIRQGQVWRLATPAFLHFNVLHLVFNMYWLHALGAQIERRRGAVRLGLMMLVIAVVSNFGQFWIGGSTLFGGMSGVVYGLLGYLWMKTIFDPGAGLYINDTTVLIMLAFLVIFFSGAFGNIANWAHLVGLGVGVVLGLAGSQMRSR